MSSLVDKVGPSPAQVRTRRGFKLRGTARGLTTAAVVAVVGFLVPSLVGSGWLSTLTTGVIFSIAAAGTGLLYGWLGLTSLTQVELAGVGAWLTMRLGFATGLPFVINLLLATIGTGVIGSLLAFPALRVRGLQLALVTLMIAGGFDVIFNATGFPNGGGGFLGYALEGNLRTLPRPGFATSAGGYFRFALVVAALAFAVVQFQLRRRPGRAWSLIGASEAAAASTGISLLRSQVWAFATAACLCGLTGGLLAGQFGQLSPSTFDVSQSMLLFALVVIAGSQHWAGWIFAVILFEVVPFALNQANVNGDLATIVFGVALMLNMLGSPRGAVGQAEDLIASVRARRQTR
jgi:branched-chain amino acid transport system permease protein